MIQDDLNQIRGVVKEEIDSALKQGFDELSRDLDSRFPNSEGKVMAEVGQYMEDYLFPMIEKKADKTDIDRLEGKLDRLIDAKLVHEQRIKDIEQLPTVAHQLKLKSK